MKNFIGRILVKINTSNAKIHCHHTNNSNRQKSCGDKYILIDI